MPLFTDQMGRPVEVPAAPQRIISLVPSQTELLYDLGLGNRVVGITKFCVHPEEWYRTKPRVGGTKKIDFDKIRALNPDLIIGNKEENEREQIENLAQDFPVWMSDIENLGDALSMITSIGNMTGTPDVANELANKITREFSKFDIRNLNLQALYLIWNNPYMVAGPNTFIHDMLQRWGFENLAPGERYPELTPEQLVELNPQLVLLSSEPFPFNEKHRTELQKLVPHAQIELVDGEFFSWYGSRLRFAPPYFNKLVKRVRGTT